MSVNLVWCELCQRGISEEESEFKELPQKGQSWFEVTHLVCGLMFEAHHREFYRRGQSRPLPPNPFVPLRIPIY